MPPWIQDFTGETVRRAAALVRSTHRSTKEILGAAAGVLIGPTIEKFRRPHKIHGWDIAHEEDKYSEARGEDLISPIAGKEEKAAGGYVCMYLQRVAPQSLPFLPSGKRDPRQASRSGWPPLCAMSFAADFA